MMETEGPEAMEMMGVEGQVGCWSKPLIESVKYPGVMSYHAQRKAVISHVS